MKNNLYLCGEIVGGNCPMKGEVPTLSHYIFWYILLNIGTMKEIHLTQGKIALVDDDNYDFLMQWKWFARKHRNTYYATRYNGRLNGKQRPNIQMHREILNATQGVQVDHEDHNGLNNQKYNIRLCTNSQNQQNKTSWGKSRFKGVCVSFVRGKNDKQKKYKTITAYINIDKKRKGLGSFATEELAAIAYNNAAKELFGEFANLNVISRIL